jgi:hypothetical protein
MYEGDLLSEKVMSHLKIIHRLHTHSRCVILLLLPSDITAYDTGKRAIDIKQDRQRTYEHNI